jgi:hypothetical protein
MAPALSAQARPFGLIERLSNNRHDDGSKHLLPALPAGRSGKPAREGDRMTRLGRFSFGAALAVAAILTTGLVAQAQVPKILAQTPCTGDSVGVCATLNDSSLGARTIRSFSFNASGAGKAVVQFEGTAFCTNANTSENSPLDFDTQIGFNANAPVSGTGPGGARFRQFIPAKVFSNGASTLNLYSSRVVPIKAAGAYTFYLRLSLNGITANTSCELFQNRFTILFFPGS